MANESRLTYSKSSAEKIKREHKKHFGDNYKLKKVGPNSYKLLRQGKITIIKRPNDYNVLSDGFQVATAKTKNRALQLSKKYKR